MIDFDELEELEALAEERDRLSSDQPICLRWVVDVSAWEPSDEEFDFLIDLVPSDNPDQVKKYKLRDDQKRSLVGRLLTHAAVATVLGIPYREISIGRTKGRKPFLCTPHNVDWAPNFNFNISHEGRYVALATENLCVVGVDVAAPLSERNQSVPQLFANLDTVCSPREWNDIRKQGSEEQQMGAFQRRWSLKEASSKPAETPNFNFNISHEGRYVALATENLCVVGVDVAAPLSQRKRNQSVPEFFATLETVCSPRECNDIRKQGSEELQSGAFQRHWSLKEAFVKARGDGLAFDPLSRAEFTIGGPLDALEPRVCVDGQARPEWNFFLEERDGYWFSVSRAPAKAIIDAVGQFTKTLKRPTLAQDEMEKALAAPNPKFVTKSVRDLLPAEALRMYDELVAEQDREAAPSVLKYP
eukprot:CAMPEP_0174300518 /NCGR_PEP_ID=MMETSP0809-20121228/58504_1 /TAXON_ID=73025 ORGANISM="Eutreptiella gymnastica-like, Strain CCMP1594" /NCGR_SAMPLE_ID=MMETSP0809 /ASSEMBLY_ACC=CAM_ASM_000658 /LENGTH=415 /DNA_ID=CAMNT_0015406097 /DNA_START=38 /DNA_END=1282 /DNA_ORIENTATION=-